jgi:type II secretory pathway pseudopilin PulG
MKNIMSTNKERRRSEMKNIMSTNKERRRNEMKNIMRKGEGFTLVELLIVVIMLLSLSLGVPRMTLNCPP